MAPEIKFNGQVAPEIMYNGQLAPAKVARVQVFCEVWLSKNIWTTIRNTFLIEAEGEVVCKNGILDLYKYRVSKSVREIRFPVFGQRGSVSLRGVRLINSLFIFETFVFSVIQ